MKKKVLILCLSCVMVIAALAGCVSQPPAYSEGDTGTAPSTSSDSGAKVEGSGEGFVIGFSNGYVGNIWRQDLMDTAERRLQAYKNEGVVADYQITNANDDVTEQQNHINALINQGCDAIIIDPNSATALASVIKTAVDKGILVVICNDVAAYDGTYSIGTDYPGQHEITANWFVRAMDEEGDTVYISGVPGNPSDTVRNVVQEEVFSHYPNIHVLAEAPGYWSDAEAQSALSNFLSTYDSLKGIITQDGMGNGLLQAYANAGIEPGIIIGDANGTFFKHWDEIGSDNLRNICVPSPASVGGWSVDFTIGLLQGREIADGALSPNPTNASMVNHVLVDIQYAVVNNEDLTNDFAAWMKENYPNCELITLDEALVRTKDIPDGYVLGYDLPFDQIFK
ncbi:hypothetical protein AGMMS49983_00530 [Clostridia bacterium]|nr:hypothetical protein AGMMS49983_00530 [Clostridia bacterium]